MSPGSRQAFDETVALEHRVAIDGVETVEDGRDRDRSADPEGLLHAENELEDVGNLCAVVGPIWMPVMVPRVSLVATRTKYTTGKPCRPKKFAAASMPSGSSTIGACQGVANLAHLSKDAPRR